MGIDETSSCIRGWEEEMSHSPTTPEFSEIDWIPAQRVHLRPGITVRVQKNAFADSPDLAALHAGRVGTIVKISGGDVVITTTDKRTPALDGAHYSPWILEMLLDDCRSRDRLSSNSPAGTG
jgi:predicted secreted protein